MLGVLNSTAASEYEVTLRRVKFSETLTFANVLRSEMTVHHALHGEWPSVDDIIMPNSPLADVADFGIVDLQMNRGSFNLTVNRFPYRDLESVNAPQWNLSFLRQTVPGQIDAVAVWVCGEAAPISQDSRSELPNLTDVDHDYLPTVCRSHVKEE